MYSTSTIDQARFAVGEKHDEIVNIALRVRSNIMIEKVSHTGKLPLHVKNAYNESIIYKQTGKTCSE